MKEDLGVRVVTAYQQFSVGRVLFPPAALRQKLVERGLVEPVLPEKVSKTTIVKR